MDTQSFGIPLLTPRNGAVEVEGEEITPEEFHSSGGCWMPILLQGPSRKESAKPSGRPPKLPEDDAKIVFRLSGGLNVRKEDRVLVQRSIQRAAQLSSENAGHDAFRFNEDQNTLIVSTPALLERRQIRRSALYKPQGTNLRSCSVRNTARRHHQGCNSRDTGRGLRARRSKQPSHGEEPKRAPRQTDGPFQVGSRAFQGPEGAVLDHVRQRGVQVKPVQEKDRSMRYVRRSRTSDRRVPAAERATVQDLQRSKPYRWPRVLAVVRHLRQGSPHG
ncbi:hypothetical protein HPB47_013974 [Ixodes persulcatus]|uniref:Uncharacterized protein n=1 Tax=Ixodes persulcatus TaxID=34615 RepID=A0AC60QZQ5_IXOPE|nr:hypothetical protein HPB47_013974 [Ixodes persulcatus]